MPDDPCFPTPVQPEQQEPAFETAPSVFPTPRAPLKPTFWNGWDAWVMLSVAIVGSLFASVLAQLGYLLLQRVLHWQSLTRSDLTTNPYFVLVTQLIVYVFLVGFIYFLITRKYRLGFSRSLKLSRLPFSTIRNFVFFGMVLAMTVIVLSSIFPSARETPLERIFGQGRAIYLFALFGIVVAPFTEELIFRGFLFPIFENLGGRPAAVLVTALIFSGLHVPQLWGSWPAMGLIFFVGLILSLIRAATGLLTPSWITHLAYNATLVLAVVSAKAFSPLLRPFR